MNKFVKYIICLLLLSCLLYFSVLMGGVLLHGYYNRIPNLRTYTGDLSHSLIRFKQADTLYKTDILIVGSSKAYMGYNPEIFSKSGFRVFNMGSSNQTPFNTYFILKHYLPRLNPDLVIMDIFYETFDNRYLAEGTTDIITNCKVTGWTAEMAIKTMNMNVWNSFLMHCLKNVFFGMENDSQREFENISYYKNGFVGNNTTRPADTAIFRPALSYAIDDEQMNYLEKTIRLCKERHVKIILVTSPQSRYYAENEKTRHIFHKGIKRIITKYSVDYYDFTNMKIDERIDFADSHHLTPAGVEKYNNQVIKYITRQH